MSRIKRQMQLTLGLCLFVGVASTLTINYHLARTQIEKQIQDRALSITYGLEFATEGLVEHDNRMILRRVVQNYATLPTVSGLAIVRPDGDPLTHTFGQDRRFAEVTSSLQLAHAIEQAAQTGVNVAASMEIIEQQVWVSVVPFSSTLFHEPRRGVIVALLDMETTEAELSQMLFGSVLVVSVTAAIVLLTLFAFVRRRILRPVDCLNDAVERSKQTGVLVRPALLPDNELGSLAESFVEVFEQMRQAQREAETASRTKSAFLATMSHEIRTPMNAVVGMTSLLLDTELTQEQREFVDTVRSSGDALLALINDILDFSKIEAGGLELEEEPFDIRLCIESAIDLMAAEATAKGLELGYCVATEVPPMLVGDITRMRQIWLNLLSNAVKFTTRGSVVVTVMPHVDADDARDASTSEAQPHERLLWAVRDTGIGIPKSRADRIFGSFSQLNASTTREYGGTGLGLAICKRLVEIMDGRIWFESPAEGGTTFFISLPWRAASDAASSVAFPQVGQNLSFDGTATNAPAVDLPDTDLREVDLPEVELIDRHLMVIAPHGIVRDFLCTTTREWGMRAHAVDSVDAAGAALDRGEMFDVIIVDVGHTDAEPGAKGQAEALLGRMRGKAQGGTVGMLAVVPLGSDREAVRQLGFDRVLTKPLRSAALRSALGRVLGECSLSATSTTRARRRARNHEMRLRILIAEDNVVNQKVATNMLAREGLRADVVANGEEAIIALRRQSYDIVLMDVQMPVLDGVEATKRIRIMLSETDQPYIVAMTASTLDQARQRYEQAGMNDYLSKPFRLEELVVTLERGREYLRTSGRTPSWRMRAHDSAQVQPSSTANDVPVI